MDRLLPRRVCLHLMAVGVILLLLPVYTPDAVVAFGGALFGVGFTFWLFLELLAGGPV